MRLRAFGQAALPLQKLPRARRRPCRRNAAPPCRCWAGAGAAPETAAPPGLEGERMVRRVSLRRQSRQLQVPLGGARAGWGGVGGG
eukprot:Skav205846  [mRNA]  locus=scaffold160:659258:661487:+ [translate_table: standard]